MPFLAVCGEGECSQMFSPQVGRQIYGKTAAPWLLQLPPHFAIFYGQLTARMNSTELRLLGHGQWAESVQLCFRWKAIMIRVEKIMIRVEGERCEMDTGD